LAREAPPMKHLFIIAACALGLWPAAARGQIVADISRSIGSVDANDITRLRDQYVAAMNGGDPIRVAELFTDDAVLVPRDGVFLKGRDEILRYFASAFRQAGDRRRHVTIRTFKTELGDTLASESGRFDETEVSAGTAIRGGGVYVIIYSRDPRGQWRVAAEVRSHGNADPVVEW
jgi:uncharacterized protein (TIGR02246 family)